MIWFTKQFERIAIQFLECNENRSKTAEILRLSWDEMNHIMAKAVKRGLERRADEPIKYIGMDEKSFLKGQNYVTVMTDAEGKKILDIAQDRDTEAQGTDLRYIQELLGHASSKTTELYTDVSKKAIDKII